MGGQKGRGEKGEGRGVHGGGRGEESISEAGGDSQPNVLSLSRSLSLFLSLSLSLPAHTHILSRPVFSFFRGFFCMASPSPSLCSESFCFPFHLQDGGQRDVIKQEISRSDIKSTTAKSPPHRPPSPAVSTRPQRWAPQHPAPQPLG